MNSTRSTQKDVASAAGVTQATVSMALSNHPAVAAQTKTHVQETARRLGYLPDPYLKGLAAYRKQRAVTKYQATLGWLSNWHKPETHKWAGVCRKYFEGAVIRANELGYSVEEHALLSPEMTPARMKQILFARNIQGLILPPQPRPGMTMEFNFDAFSVVTFGYTLVEPHFHTIGLHHYRSMEMLFHELLALGYRCPGLVIREEEDMRTDCIWSSAFWRAQHTLPPAQRIPILTLPKIDLEVFQNWLNHNSPDVVIASDHKVYEWMVASGVRVPEEAGFASLSMAENDSSYAGIWQNLRETGAMAVDFLVNMLHTGERGVPRVRASLLVDATWVNGQTVRPQ